MTRISNIADHTGFWMRMVSNAVSHEFSRILAIEDVTVAEWVFMRSLFDREPTTPSELAERMGMTKGAISKLADRLIAKGLVSRCDSAVDKRSRSLELTATGRAKVPSLAELADDNDRNFFGSLSPDEHAVLLRILKSLASTKDLNATPVD